MNEDEKLLAELEEASRGLEFLSESDYPFQTVFLRGEAVDISHHLLREWAGAQSDAPIEETSVDHFFRVAVSEPDWKGEAEIATARRYQALVRLLKENLQGLTVYRVGRVSIAVFILGRTSVGNWLGISTRVVET